MDATKSPSPKKRKSTGNPKKTPSKKINVEIPTSPEKTPKKSAVQNLNESISKSAKKNKFQNSKGNKKDKEQENINDLPKFGETKTLDSKESKKQGTKPLVSKEGKKQGTKTSGPQEGKKNRRRAGSSRSAILQKMVQKAEQEGKEEVIKNLNEKIDQISSRAEVTKSAMKKIKYFKFLIKFITEGKKPSAETSSTKAEPQKPKDNKKAKKNKEKVQKVIQKQESDDDSDDEEQSDDESDDSESGSKAVEKMEQDQSDSDEEGAEEESEDEDEEEEEDDDEEETDSEGETPSKVITKKEKVNGTDIPKQNNTTGKKSRYVLFVGNLAYDATKDEIRKHFNSVGEVVDVRIPTDQQTSKPRGFAYVELANEASYQKAMDMNGSQLKNRKIKVEYTQGGKKNTENKKKEIKAKNFKLQAMRKQGKFGGENKQNGGKKFQKRPNEGKKFQKKPKKSF